MVHPEELEPADRPGAATAEGGIAVELPEAVEQRFAEAWQYVAVILA